MGIGQHGDILVKSPEFTHFIRADLSGIPAQNETADTGDIEMFVQKLAKAFFPFAVGYGRVGKLKNCLVAKVADEFRNCLVRLGR